MNNNTVEKAVKLTQKLAELILSIILPAEATKEDIKEISNRMSELLTGFYMKALEKTEQLIATNDGFTEEEAVEIREYNALFVDSLLNLFEGRPWMTDFIRSIRWGFGPLGLRLLKSIVTLDYIREIRTMVQEHLKSKEEELDRLSETIEKYYSTETTGLELTDNNTTTDNAE